MAQSARILLVDDDADFCEALSDRLRALGFQVTVADRGVEALRLVREDAPSVVLLDLVLPGLDGMTVLETLRREEPDVAVVVITGYGTIARAVEAMKKGAYDFVTKPVDARHLEIVLGKVFERQALRDANALLSSEVSGRYSAIVGDSPAVRAVLDVTRRAAARGAIRSPLPAKPPRVLRHQPFEPVASTRPIQADIRFVAATNRDLRQAVRDGQFRLDLYYRLDVVSVTLPPLRERPGDIAALAQHFLDRYRREVKRDLRGIRADTLACLRRYPWPGNFRELEDGIERAVVRTEGAESTRE